MAFCTLMCACEDEQIYPAATPGNEICFQVIDDRDWSDMPGRSGEAMGCEYHGSVSVASDYGQPLYLHTVVNDDLGAPAISRAAPFTTTDLKSFRLSAYAYSGEWTNPAAANFIINENVTPAKDGLWNTSDNHYWPASHERVRFIAHANMPGTLSAARDIRRFTYSVSNNVSRQNDMVIAVADESAGWHISNKIQKVELIFHHLLTAIRFRMAENDNELKPYRIKSVGFKNISMKGSFNLGDFSGDPDADRDAMWTVDAPAEGSTMTVTFADDRRRPEGGVITEPEETMMMIPQVLGADAAVRVVLANDEGLEFELETSLAGLDWGMGEKIDYVISSKSILEETVLVLYTVQRTMATGEVISEAKVEGNTYNYTAPYYNYDYYDGKSISMTSHYRIESYRKQYLKHVDGKPTGDVKYTPLDVEYEYPEDGGQPEWLRRGDREDGGGYFDIVVDAQPLEQDDPWTRVLKSRTVEEVMPLDARDSEGYYDLSLAHGERSTANCYIINAPGLYKFPVVYGNAIRHGKLNPEAFGLFERTPDKVEGGKSYYSNSSGELVEAFDQHGELVYHKVKGPNNDTDETYDCPVKYVSAYPEIRDAGGNSHMPYRTADGDYSIFQKDPKNNRSVRVENAQTPRIIWADYPEIIMPLSSDLAARNVAGTSGEEYLGIKDFNGSELRTKFIRFEIKQADIEQGNIMIGYTKATNDKQVLWSWHIWITPFSPHNHNGLNDAANATLEEPDKIMNSVAFTSSTGETMSLMPYNLGWCNRVYLTFGTGDRNTVVRCRQKETGNYIDIAVHQPQAFDTQFGNNLLFQWGRKDPMRGSFTFGKYTPILKRFYTLNKAGDNYEEYVISPKYEKKKVNEVLKEPQFVYGADSLARATYWCQRPYQEMWRIKELVPDGVEQVSGGKTIFDPSPVGFMVAGTPVYSAFLGGFWVDNPIKGLESDWKSKPLYFSVCGYRGNRGEMVGAGEEAYYHSITTDGRNSKALHLKYGSTAEIVDIPRAWCAAVRPREDRKF